MKQKKANASLQMLFISIMIAILMLALLILSNYISRRRDCSLEVWNEEQITVIIDAGHGGEDGGALGENGVLEKDLNLDVAKRLDSLLRSAGINTVMTRKDDRLLYDPLSDYKGRKKILDMQERLRLASSCENAIFVSIHMNSFPQKKYCGLQVYYSKNNADSKRLAESIQRIISSYLQPQNERKTKPGNDIFLLDRLKMPAILVECGFISNTNECQLLSTEEYRDKLAFWIFYSIISEIN